MGSAMLLSLFMAATIAHVPEGKSHPSVQAAERINRLASPDSILSEADSRSYVDALASKWGIDDPSFEDFKERVARTEFLAIRDPSARISEGSVAGGFNILMEEFGSPREMRLTREQVHNFRRNLLAVANASAVYPKMFARRANGSLDDLCRPVEALYLIFLLQYGPNLEASTSKLKDATRRTTANVSVRATFAVGSVRESEYSAAVDRYCRKHGGKGFTEALDRILTQIMGVRA